MIGSSTEESAYRVVTFGMKQHKDNATMPAEGAAYYDDPNPEIALLNGVYIVYGNANHPSDDEWQSVAALRLRRTDCCKIVPFSIVPLPIRVEEFT